MLGDFREVRGRSKGARREVWADREGNGWVLSVTEDDPAAEWAALPDSEARELRGKIPGQKRAWNQVEDELKRKRRRDDGLSDVMRRAEAVGRVDAPEATTLQSDVKVAFSFGGAPAVSNDDTWARPGLIVKARAGKTLQGGAFDKVKCVVRGVSTDGVTVETPTAARARCPSPSSRPSSRPSASASASSAARTKAKWRRSRALDLGAFAARIRLEASGEVVEGVPYEDVCKGGVSFCFVDLFRSDLRSAGGPRPLSGGSAAAVCKHTKWGAHCCWEHRCRLRCTR